MSRFNIIFAALLSVFLVNGCTEKPVLVVQAVPGEQSIAAKAGKSFSIQLKGQMSTGYSWKLSELPASFEIIKEDVKTLEKDIAGGEDIQQFIYRSAQKGDFILTFRYAEHWKKKPKYVKTATVKVRIE